MIVIVIALLIFTPLQALVFTLDMQDDRVLPPQDPPPDDGDQHGDRPRR
jgi:hypothetical protein